MTTMNSSISIIIIIMTPYGRCAAALAFAKKLRLQMFNIHRAATVINVSPTVCDSRDAAV